MQSRRKSFIESVINTAVATVIGILVSPFVYWFWGVDMSPLKFTKVTATFILISFVRNYALRRLFSKRENK